MLEEAGIRGVLFDHKNILKAQAVAKDLGIDSDWNNWISLDDSADEHVVGRLGQEVLPFGLAKIKKHLEDNVDDIPLRVRIFCNSDKKRQEQMFCFYQENYDVVACIGNVLNSENLRSFIKANVAIGMMIEPSYRCKRCNGRISIE